MFKGLFILLLGVGIAISVIVKIQSGMPPSPVLTLAFGALALVANLYRLRLLWPFRSEDMNMASTFECSRNDVISNSAVLIAAAAVALLQSPWPDIAIGSAMALPLLRAA